MVICNLLRQGWWLTESKITGQTCFKSPFNQLSRFIACFKVLHLFLQVNVYKQPITDSSKNSKKGLLSLELDEKGNYVTIEEGKGDAEKVTVCRYISLKIFLPFEKLLGIL